MEIRTLSPRFAVSEQLCAEDMPAIAGAGIKTVICNRPDAEIPAEQHHHVLSAAAKAAGLNFEVLELTMQTMTPQNVARQHALMQDSEGPVLAYCRTGTRCSVVWALTQAGTMSTDDILAAANAAGYDISRIAPTLDQMADSDG